METKSDKTDGEDDNMWSPSTLKDRKRKRTFKIPEIEDKESEEEKEAKWQKIERIREWTDDDADEEVVINMMSSDGDEYLELGEEKEDRSGQSDENMTPELKEVQRKT